MLACTFLATGGLLAAALVGSKVALFTTRLVSGLGSAVVPVAGPRGTLSRVSGGAPRAEPRPCWLRSGAGVGDLAADGS